MSFMSTPLLVEPDNSSTNGTTIDSPPSTSTAYNPAISTRVFGSLRPTVEISGMREPPNVQHSTLNIERSTKRVVGPSLT